MALLALIMIPDMITLVPTFLVLRTLGFLDNLAALVAVYVSGGQAVSIFILRQFFASIPAELIDAARIDGASETQVLGRIVLPLSKSVLVTVALMNALTVWNDYIWPLVTLSDTRGFGPSRWALSAFMNGLPAWPRGAPSSPGTSSLRSPSSCSSPSR